jgi:mitofusin 2
VEVVADVLTSVEDYLRKLKLRIQDNSSKVLITGDLNSGKSTLINALLQQNILPTDQQPCTQSFCEIIPFEGNQTISKIKAYRNINLTTETEGDDINQSKMQEELQDEDSQYKWFKIFVSTPMYMNFTHNQIAVSFIDSPGLNTDLFKTTSLFNQQQDIDVIVFVINASFHLTLSGREFLQQAAKEKEQIFFVVNKTDEIENFKKCKKLISKQIREILPGTLEDAQSLIHFVSAKQYLKNLHEIDMVPSRSIDVNTEENNTKTPLSIFSADFDTMKQSLVNFLYLKRSISKLAPAKTYATKILQDILELSTYNMRIMKSEALNIESHIKTVYQLVQRQEEEDLELKTHINGVTASTTEACYVETLKLAESFSDEISKNMKFPRFLGILSLRSTINEKYQFISKCYSRTISEIERETLNSKQKGVDQLNSVAELYEVKTDLGAILEPDFKLYSSMPLHKPSILELIDPNELLKSFGALNLTSIVGFVVGFQPCINVAWNLAQKIGVNPWIIGTLLIGGIGTYSKFYISNLMKS